MSACLTSRRTSRNAPEVAGQIRSCCFDLETSNLAADFGVVLCGVVKPAGGEPIIFRGDDLVSNWRAKRSDDSATVRAITRELNKYDILIAHNGRAFDLPFIRTRLLRFGPDLLENRKLVDPVLLARNKLRMSYNSLDKIATHLGVNSKTEVEPKHWLKAALDGSRKSMDYIVEHCVQDVYVLERVVGQLKHYCTAINTWGSGF